MTQQRSKIIDGIYEKGGEALPPAQLVLRELPFTLRLD